jgi:hypothetical protein
MKHHTPSPPATARRTGFVLLPLLLAAGFAGCASDQGYYSNSSYRGRPSTHVAAVATYNDDYVYYPAHETYYSRNRHEYVYRDGNAWVRRPQPNGVTADVLIQTPSVRLDFHDSPERHHDAVVKQYPRTWRYDRNRDGIDDRYQQPRD